jgi:hypothetical protein
VLPQHTISALLRLFELTTHRQWSGTDELFAGSRLLTRDCLRTVRDWCPVSGELLQLEHGQQAGAEYFVDRCGNPRCAQPPP